MYTFDDWPERLIENPTAEQQAILNLVVVRSGKMSQEQRIRELEVSIIFALQCIDPNHAGARVPGSLVGTPEWNQQAVDRLRRSVGIPLDAPDY